MATGQDADVIIVGAGIFGLACAWECRARGLSVLLIEQSEPASGSSGGMVGTLAPHVPESWSDRKQFQLSALLAAHSWWQRVDRASGLASGYGRIGRVQPLTSELQRDRAIRRIAGAARHWHGVANWQVGDTPWLERTAAPFGAITDDLTARLDPLAACRSLARACFARGCPATWRAGGITGWRRLGAGRRAGSDGAPCDRRCRTCLVRAA